jgi:histidine triad (HIT) family protein
MNTACLFCDISRKDDALIWQNLDFVAFKDINPKAKTHVLIVPKVHVDSLDDLDALKEGGLLIEATQQVASHLGVAGAYRIQINVGADGGQEIDHLHIHLLSDRKAVE